MSNVLKCLMHMHQSIQLFVIYIQKIMIVKSVKAQQFLALCYRVSVNQNDFLILWYMRKGDIGSLRML